MSSATVVVSKESKHEGFRSKMDEFDEKLMKFPKSVHHGLHKGADKTFHKVADGTKKILAIVQSDPYQAHKEL
ncbi:hypothetical protein Cantr_02004 [Candida viswanathii]|uniref:Uncharacterized protein n=1 Tax=Candida viswanathii TaxID=5486 RepID=A0A367YKV3_9ASCO|nr:hypothetical protein Cantr_02004 [Candida viswanathii]